MLDYLRIKNFKSHVDTSLELAPLTVLTGANGVGKSSIIQVFLLLRQSFQKNRLHAGLDLNGSLCSLGKVEDITYTYAENNQLEFLLQHAGKDLRWQFSLEDIDATFAKQASSSAPPLDKLPALSIFNAQFQFLSAARLSPQESYPKDTYSVEQEQQISIQEGKGELVAHFLSHYGFPSDKNGNKKVMEALRHPSEERGSLLYQTEAWMREISSGIQIKVQESDKSFELKYAFEREGDIPTDDFRPKNVGFGVSYTLAVVVAILAAQPGALILIENPEAHIHPSGQAKIAELMALAAQHGVQLLIETHSDHIVNGILVACKAFEEERGGIAREAVAMYYLDLDSEQHSTRATAIPIQPGGVIMHPPQGFFDQIQIDLERLTDF